MKHDYRKCWVAIASVGVVFASLGTFSWADENVYVATPDGRLVPQPPETPAQRDNPYTPDAVHTYRWDGGIIVKEEHANEKPGVIGVQPDPARANVDPAEVPPGNVIVQEPVDKQE